MPVSLRPLLRSLSATGVALRNGAIRRATLGFLAYNAVEMAVWTAILVYAYAATGPASVGIVAVTQLVPSAILAPFLANIGDRYPRARVLVAWFLVQALVIAAVGVVIQAGVAPVIVYAVSALATVTLTQTRPILASLLPELARTPDELTAANALGAIMVGLGGFMGPLAVGILLVVATPAVVFLASAFALLLGCALLVGLHGHPDAAVAHLDDADDVPAELDPRGLLAGLRAVASDADLAIVIALMTGQFLIFGGMEVLLVLIAIDLLGLGESGAGFLLSAVGLGAILGGGAAFALVGRRRLAPFLGVAAVIIGLPIALVGVAPGGRSAAILLVIAGIGFAVLETTGQTLLQRITPDVIRARVFGVLEGLLLVGEAAGSLLVAPIALAIGLERTSIVLGLLLPVIAAIAVSRFARIDRRVFMPEAELHALRHVSMLAPLGPAALESVARHLVHRSVVAGEIVIREGDPGDRWYLVDQGRFLVTRDGVHRNELTHGDGFGEIALLRAVPRTASVSAAVDGSLWYLERDQFLAAVTGSPQALLEAELVAAERIATDARR